MYLMLTSNAFTIHFQEHRKSVILLCATASHSCQFYFFVFRPIFEIVSSNIFIWYCIIRRMSAANATQENAERPLYRTSLTVLNSLWNYYSFFRDILLCTVFMSVWKPTSSVLLYSTETKLFVEKEFKHLTHGLCMAGAHTFSSVLWYTA